MAVFGGRRARLCGCHAGLGKLSAQGRQREPRWHDCGVAVGRPRALSFRDLGAIDGRHFARSLFARLDLAGRVGNYFLLGLFHTGGRCFHSRWNFCRLAGLGCRSRGRGRDRHAGDLGRLGIRGLCHRRWRLRRGHGRLGWQRGNASVAAMGGRRQRVGLRCCDKNQPKRDCETRHDVPPTWLLLQAACHQGPCADESGFRPVRSVRWALDTGTR